jgi:hypothetical protein
VLVNRCPRHAGVPAHPGSLPHNRRAALTPALKGGASAPQAGEDDEDHIDGDLDKQGDPADPLLAAQV